MQDVFPKKESAVGMEMLFKGQDVMLLTLAHVHLQYRV
jgi:hypothetical protein